MQPNAKPAVMVQHNPEANRFETVVNGQLSFTTYRMEGRGIMAMTHTEVPLSLRRRGVAGELVRAAVEHARRHGLRIAPYCSYVRSYVQRHPETHDVLA